MGTILLVDDEPAVLHVVADILRTQKHTVIETSNVTQATTACTDSGSRIDLLVADVMLPDGRVEDLVVEVRGRWPHLPVLLTSGYPLEDLEAKGLVETLLIPPGRTEFLEKPFTAQALLEKVTETLKPRAIAAGSSSCFG